MPRQFNNAEHKLMFFELLEAHPGGLLFAEIRKREPRLDRTFLNGLANLTGSGYLIEQLVGERTRYRLAELGYKELAKMRATAPGLRR